MSIIIKYSQHLKIISEQGNQVMYRIAHPQVLQIIQSAVEILELRTNQLQQLQQMLLQKEMG